MSQPLDNSFKSMFVDSWIHISRQQGSIMRPLVKNIVIEGKEKMIDFMDGGSVREITSKFAKTEYSNVNHTRRRIATRDFTENRFVDNFDMLRSIANPTSDYLIGMVQDMGNQMDDLIIEAASGTVGVVAANGDVTNTALPASQIIDKDIGASDSNLNVAKLRAIKKSLLEAHVDFRNEELVMVINPSAHDALLDETAVISRDFNERPVMSEGMVDRFLGIKFIISNRLLGAGTSGDPAKMIAFTKSGLYFGVSKEVEVNMDKDSTHNFNDVLHVKSSFNAIRAEDAKVLIVECVQA